MRRLFLYFSCKSPLNLQRISYTDYTKSIPSAKEHLEINSSRKGNKPAISLSVIPDLHLFVQLWN